MTYTLYDGPYRPKGILAIVKLGVISDVDGGDLTYLTGHKLAVLPGRHTLRLLGAVKLDSGEWSPSDCSFDVDVEAQHVYEGIITRGKSGRGGDNVSAVMDKTMNMIVARNPPLSPTSSKAGAASGSHSQSTEVD